MKLSRQLQVLFVSVFVAAPAMAAPLSLCGGDKVEKAEKAEKVEKAKAEKKADKSDKKDESSEKVASKDSA